MPALVTAFYLWTRAADQYASDVAFSVRTEEKGSAIELLGGITELSGSSSSDTDILYLSANKAIDSDTRKAIFDRVNAGKLNILINHPSTWYNWNDWPEYNKELVGGGSTSHEKLQTFEVKVLKPNHPIMKGVPSRFRIYDELYRWKKDPEGTEIEVLAMGRGLKSGEEFPVVWVVKHPKAKIIGNTLGHDERAHDLKAYKTILKNSLYWVKE